MPNLLTHLNIGDQKTTINSIHYIVGTGSTAGTWLGTDGSIDEYYDGLTLAYKIPVAGATTTTLNITGSAGTALGAKTVYRNGSSKITTQYGVGSVVLLVYMSTGSYPGWHCVDYDSNSNTIPSAYCETAAATAAKTASCTNYVLLNKSFIHVLIKTSNTSKTALTFDINGKGAKPIYINGAATSASNYTLPAGSYLVYYDGTNYYFRTDGLLTASITGNATTADVATKDDAGNTISDYIKGLSASGKTITYTRGDDTTGTITTQDTTYGPATTTANGLMRGTDKVRLDNMWSIWEADGTQDAIVDTVAELLAIFATYPEGADIAKALADKSNKTHTHTVNGHTHTIGKTTGTVYSISGVGTLPSLTTTEETVSKISS
jgi:hypothetical protein